MKNKLTRPRDERGEWGMAIVGLLVIFAVIGMLTLSIASALHTETMTCTVDDKDRTTKSDGTSDARLYTEDCGTLRVGDSLLSWTWSSSDTYASIDPGQRYEVTTRGFRIPFFSMFPNVVEATPVSE